jgi:hypothetical protein
MIAAGHCFKNDFSAKHVSRRPLHLNGLVPGLQRRKADTNGPSAVGALRAASLNGRLTLLPVGGIMMVGRKQGVYAARRILVPKAPTALDGKLGPMEGSCVCL